jgi:phosphoenolpyruvate carboxykinase (ATP)
MKILQNHPHLNLLGITAPNRIYWQLNTPQLYEEAVQRHEGYVAHLGPLVVRTGNQTSLAHSDRYIVSEPATEGHVHWGEINRPFNAERFDKLLERMAAYFQGLDIFVQNGSVRTAAKEQMPIRIITETAWHSLFARNNYHLAGLDESDDFKPEFTVLHAPGFRAIPERDKTNTDVFVIIHLKRNLILIGGTSFAGEIQKAIFSVVNYLLPRRDILTLECAANIGDKGDVALFVGCDRSGKSTLATDNMRTLLGDSEHGWDKEGIFSIGRGCYARLLGLKMENSPDIWQTTRRFGTILENVVVDAQTRQLDLTDGTFTENTRASYPISHTLRATRDGVANHPRNVILLSKDSFGVLPPVSKLSHEQAQFYFLSGYTTQFQTDNYGETVAKAKFSACYGAPFMPLRPKHYTQMFSDNIKRHNVDVWLLNTGWIGGAYGQGERIPLEISRNIVRAIVNGKLENAEFRPDGYFNLMIPGTCSDVPPNILHPATYWTDEAAYIRAVHQLIRLFDENSKQYQNEIDDAILAAQPGAV